MKRGPYNKYEIFKDGEPVEDRCFVLKPESDPVAVEALRTYAVCTPNRRLSIDLLNWIFVIEERGEKVIND